MALAEKHKRSGAVVIAFLGDGTLGEGVVYEALNMAALWRAPLLYVVENNRIAQTTPVDLALAGDIAARFSAFSIPFAELDSSDVRLIYTYAGKQLTEVRNQGGPRALILHTCRFGPHSKGDDTRPEAEIARLRRERDPLTIHGARLEPRARAEIEGQVEAEIAQAFSQALADEYPQPDFEPVGVRPGARSSN
jgi:TPP-dependent pyruvate/acetoin dehydrogenase alpha subunit